MISAFAFFKNKYFCKIWLTFTNDYPFRLRFEKTRDKFIEFEQKHLDTESCCIFCSVDGSLQSLPNIPRLRNFFGTYGKGRSSPTARMSLLYGSLRHFIYDAMIAPVGITERKMALSSLQHIKKIFGLSNMVVVFDRGYQGFNFFKKLAQPGVHYIVRVKDKFHGLEDLEPEADYIIRFPNALTARAIKIKLDSSTVETLVTDLVGPVPSLFKELYFLRWPVEIAFYFIKHVLRLGDFNGYNVNSIYQDF